MLLIVCRGYIFFFKIDIQSVESFSTWVKSKYSRIPSGSNRLIRMWPASLKIKMDRAVIRIQKKENYFFPPRIPLDP
ncbi:hypothetical protein ACN1CD_23550, partial [Pedobacter sp. N23S346]